MGIRGHIQTTHANYDGGDCISSWKGDEFKSFLIDKGIQVDDDGESGDQWGIWISDELRALVKELCENKYNDEINALFTGGEGEDLRSAENARQLGDFLKCGIDIADEKGYEDIIIDWF